VGARAAIGTLLLLAGSARADGLDLAQFTHRSDSEAGWKGYGTKGAVTLERRAVAGSKFYEHRSIIELPVEPERAAEEVWATMSGGDMESLKRREILRQSADEIVMYDQIRAPVVSDRDYTVSVRRVHDPLKRRWEFRCETHNELGPPPAPGYVRIPVVRAGWIVEPDGRGGTRLTYYAYSEPGGLIAAFVARGAQADRALADVIRMALRMLQQRR